MIKSISYWSMKDGLAGTHPIDDALQQAKSNGFDGMELCIGVEGVLTPSTSQEQCEKIRSLTEQSGLVVETLASGMSWALNPTSEDPEVRKQAISNHQAALRRAAWLGCKAMLFVPGVVCSPIVPGEHIRYDLALERAREAVGQLLDVAEEVQIDLCIENVWNGLFYSPVELASFVRSFNSDRLGVYFDVGNVLGYHQYPPHWIEILGLLIKRVHIKDYQENFDWNGNYSFCGLGQGDVPWDATMQSLQEIGYDSTVVAEMLPYKEGLLEETSLAMDKIIGIESAV